MVEVKNKPLVAHVFDRLVELNASELIVVVGHMKEQIIKPSSDEYRDTPITYAHQREQAGLTHALFTVEGHVDDDFMLMLEDNIFQANLEDVINRQRANHTDAAFLVEEVPYDGTSRYGVCDTNEYREIVDIVEKPDDPPRNLVMTSFYTFMPAIFYAAHLI